MNEFLSRVVTADGVENFKNRSHKLISRRDGQGMSTDEALSTSVHLKYSLVRSPFQAISASFAALTLPS